ncbi:MAG: efflux RND transporter periplasmic adaptor subunit [Alphaproteobacteria bacterium]|nr:efflux RND transporter periplasmic adaptor subunit [Alphaproteobacteria bacterium]
MAKLHSTSAMLAISTGITLVVIALINMMGDGKTTAVTDSAPRVAKVKQVESKPLLDMSAKADETKTPPPLWAASATGRIETRTGEHRLGALTPGRIVDVLVKTHDKMKAGDLLVQLDDEDLKAKRDSAFAEVQVRLRERAEERVTGLALERQDAEDALAAAQRALFDARQAFDTAQMKLHRGSGGSEKDVTAAREKRAAAEADVEKQRDAYERVIAKADMPHPTRLDTGLTQARADLSLVENAIEQTRIRAPFDGDVLNVWAKVGEVAAPSAGAPLVLFGDLSTMRVRAELEERDVVKVRIGQKVVVRSDAHPGQDFIGKVASLGGALGARNIASRGPRRPSDIDVLEVVADLGAQPQLLPGMRVDVFFASDETAQSSPTSSAQ